MSRHREGEREREGESTLQVKCEIKKCDFHILQGSNL